MGLNIASVSDSYYFYHATNSTGQLSTLSFPFTQSLVFHVSDVWQSKDYGITLGEVLVTLFILAIPFILQYVASLLFFHIACWSTAVERAPPKIPYVIPFLGSALEFGLHPGKFVTTSALVSLCHLKSQYLQVASATEPLATPSR